MADTSEKPKSKEQLEREWWDRWWAEDYSWEGLGRKHWIGWLVDKSDGSIHAVNETSEPAIELARTFSGRVQRATLQDYWREEEGNLISSPDGKRKFTRVHLPLAWRDGTPTVKQGWADDKLDAILASKLIVGAETKTDAFGIPQGPDRRTQLQGTILLRECADPQDVTRVVHLQCTQAMFSRRADFSHRSLGHSAWFVGTAFVDGGNFENATFSGAAKFVAAVFAQDVDFENATFSGDLEFENATFVGSSNFDGTKYQGAAGFEKTSFYRDAEFNDARFAGSANFGSASFLGSARFARANFSDNAWFAGASFYGFTEFLTTSFLGYTAFARATFADEAEFEFVIFHKDAWFTSDIGDGEPGPVVFSKKASFDSAVFKAPARFGEARFVGRMKFDKALFHAIADFSKVVVPQAEKDWRGAFDGVLFERAIDLRGVDARAVSMVAGATFDRDVLLDRTSESEEARAHADALKQADAAEDREDALKALEGGALKLKQAMNTANDIAREQRFYRLELRARRKQKGTRLSERVVSALYALASGYGASLGRPVIALFSVVTVFAVWFWAWEGGAVSGGPAKWPGQAARVDSNFVDSMRYSLSRTFPFGPWAINDDRLTSEAECGFASRLQALDVAPSAVTAVPGVVPEMIQCRPRVGFDEAQLAGHRLWVGVVGTLESLLSLPLYFLLGLAIRRKFQIS